MKITKNGMRWTIREGYESILDKIDIDNLSSITNGRTSKVIKDTKVRSVILLQDLDAGGALQSESSTKSDVYVAAGTTGVYIKLFKRKDYIDYLKYLFTPAKPWIEWRAADELLSKGINTALPIAMVEKRTWNLLGSSMIITKAIPRSEPLMEFCKTTFGGILSKERLAEKKKLLSDLAGLIKNIHRKGFFHKDLHAGNILIKFNNDYFSPAKDYSLFLMDLHHVKIKKKLSHSKRLYNLAQLFNSLSFMLTKSDRLYFVKSYGINGFDNLKDVQEITSQIETESFRIRNVHYKSRLKRCLKESSNFSRRKHNDMVVFYRRGYDTHSLVELIAKHNNALANNNDANVIIKCDDKTALTRFPFIKGEIKSVVVKQYKIICGLCLLKNIFRNSPGRRSWIAGNGLSIYGFNSAKPLALIERKILGIVADSYLIMEDVNNSMEMDRFILKYFNHQLRSAQLNDESHILSPSSVRPKSLACTTSFRRGMLQGGEGVDVIRTNKVPTAIELDQLSIKDQYGFNTRIVMKKERAFISNFAKTIAEMHNHNIFHSDLKTCNIMVREVNDKYQVESADKGDKTHNHYEASHEGGKLRKCDTIFHLSNPYKEWERLDVKNVNKISDGEEDKLFDFTFLDYDKVDFNEKITIQKRVKNLVQINLSTPGCITIKDRLRFLKEYLSTCLSESNSQSYNTHTGPKLCGLTVEKKAILKEIIDLSKTEKILYVSFDGDVTEDW